jgi:hypothetical protein
MTPQQIYQAYKTIWHESGAWRKHTLEDFIKGVVEIVKNNNKK